jgi:hypothetical protein
MTMQFNHGINLSKPAWIVVCRHSRDFHLGHAASVKRQFERKAGGDWDFVCLTDRPCEDWHLPLRTDWPGWWAILESFFLTGPSKSVIQQRTKA